MQLPELQAQMTPVRVSPVNISHEHTQAHSVSELPVDVASTFLGGVSHDDWPHHFMPVIRLSSTPSTHAGVKRLT